MRKTNPNPTKTVKYEIRKQFHGRFRVVEIYMGNDGFLHKRSLKKNLLYTDAEELIYKLESK